MTDSNDTKLYTTQGRVRGTCGHRHRSIDTAVRCLNRDRSGCRSQGGYSDRQVMRVDGSDLTQLELEWLREVL